MEEALDACVPDPVSVESGRLSKSKKKAAKKRKSSTKKSHSEPKRSKTEPRPSGGSSVGSPGAAASDLALEVLDSFEDKYKDVLKMLPPVLWPSSTKHGAHSYTATLA